MSRLRRDHRRLVASLERARAWASHGPTFEARAERVSGWAVGRHLEHLLRSDRAILGWMVEAVDQGGSPADGGPTWRGRAVLLTGFIPRGKGDAPDFTVPRGLARDEVEAGLGEMAARAQALGEDLGAVARCPTTLPHPALGSFTAAQWVRFASVHHRHHEKVIRDILRAAGVG